MSDKNERSKASLPNLSKTSQPIIIDQSMSDFEMIMKRWDTIFWRNPILQTMCPSDESGLFPSPLYPEGEAFFAAPSGTKVSLTKLVGLPESNNE